MSTSVVARKAIEDLPRRWPLKYLLQFLCVLLRVAAEVSQAQLQSGAGGLMGQVFCSDTQKPARFAMVRLLPDVTDAHVNTYGMRRGLGSSTTAPTATDGTFIMKDVPAGVYDVEVTMPGYIQPARQLAFFPDGDSPTRQTFIKMLTRVIVQAGQTTNATVTAYRGADLVGSVFYDDGTPAAGLTISPLLAVVPAGTSSTGTATTTTLRNVGSESQTDDRGRFHLSGLADGTYTLQAQPRRGGMFPVYLGNTINRPKATMIAIKAGEERTGLDLIVNITDLHQVRGVVTDPEGRGLPNASVTLQLADSPGASLSDTTAPDGSFNIAPVPDGSFITAASTGANPDSHITYQSAETRVTVSGSDVNDVVLQLTQ